MYLYFKIHLTTQITAKTMTETGDPKELICDTVEKSNVQLLVLGSHSRGAISRFVLFLDHVLLRPKLYSLPMK